MKSREGFLVIYPHHPKESRFEAISVLRRNDSQRSLQLMPSQFDAGTCSLNCFCRSTQRATWSHWGWEISAVSLDFSRFDIWRMDLSPSWLYRVLCRRVTRSQKTQRLWHSWAKRNLKRWTKTTVDCASSRSKDNKPDAIATSPLNTLVLWRQFPTRIHREVSSATFAGSTIM